MEHNNTLDNSQLTSDYSQHLLIEPLSLSPAGAMTEGLHSTGKDIPSSHFTSNSQTYIHLLKGSVGPGCLSLPWAFSILGVPLGLAATGILCILTSYNALCVMKVKKSVMDKRGVTYSDLGRKAYGLRFGRFVATVVCVQQMAICTVYFTFIAENIAAVVLHSSGGTVAISHRSIMLLTLPFVTALVSLPNLRVIAPATEGATLLLFFAFLLVGIVIVESWDVKSDTPVGATVGSIPQALAAIMYSYEGINLIFPVESAMRRPASFNQLFIMAMTTVCGVFFTVGAVCVMAFGFVDDGSLAAFLMKNADQYVGSGGVALVYITNIAVSISVLLTYPLQMFPCFSLVSQMACCGGGGGNENQVDILDLDYNDMDDIYTDHYPSLSGGGGNDSQAYVLDSDNDNMDSIHADQCSKPRTCLSESDIEGDSFRKRMTLVLITFVVALTIPDVQELISLAGALAGSSTALIIPPLLTLRYIPELEDNRCGLQAVRCYLLVLVGVVLAIGGTAASITDIVKQYV